MAIGVYSSSTATPLYSLNPIIGINLTTTHTSASGPKHALGTIVHTTRGAKFQYVKAGSTVAQYDCVNFCVPGSATTVFSQFVAPITTTTAAKFQKVGFAQVAIASGDYAWVQTGGPGASVTALAACQPGVPLYTTGTAGQLDDAVVSAACLVGVTALSSSSAGGASVVQIMAGDAINIGWNGLN